MLLAALATGLSLCSSAQDTTVRGKDVIDTTVKADGRPDTIKIGGLVIVRDGKGDVKSKRIWIGNNNRRSNANVSTNWFILDFGFSNWSDRSNYANAAAQGFYVPNAAANNPDPLKLRTGKSVNVNIWIFMQKLNIAKHIVNLKYGLGLELNNYHFDDKRVRFSENPTSFTLDPNASNVSKNKLAADYVTVPLMLNFNFTPNRSRNFGFSAGVSAGYLYSARQKFKTGGKKEKTHDDFDLEPWKLSWIGELQLGPVRFYGSYAMNNMWKKGLDMTPYSVGLRFSRW